MSKRSLIIAAVVLVILALASQWFSRSKTEKIDQTIGEPILTPKQVETFDELVLQNAESILTLQKKDATWVIKEKGGYPVDMKKLLELMDKLTHTEVASLVTTDVKRQAYFQVVYWDQQKADATVSGTQLTLKNKGSAVFRMMTGKKRMAKSNRPDTPSTPDGVFIRIGDSASVYLLGENLNLEPDPAQWIQTSLFSLDKKEITSIRYEGFSPPFLLERAEKGEEMVLAGLSGDEKMESYEVSSVLSNLETFTIDEVYARSDLAETDLKLRSILTVAVYDSPELQFKVFSKERENPLGSEDEGDEEDTIYFVSFIKPAETQDDNRWNAVYTLNESWIFKLDTWKAKRWTKSRQDFIAEKDEG